MANVKIPYQLIPAVALDRRRENVKSALARGLPRLQRQQQDDSKTLYIACFGPSLRETWQELRGKSPIISMSGATKWLASNGIIADYAIEMDPRESQLVVSPPVPGVHHLIASCVHPKYFDLVLGMGNKVTLWHTVNSNWDDELTFIAQNDPDQLVVHAGSTAGLGAIHLGGIMGFNRFVIHGMDGSFGKDGVRHASFHGGKDQPPDITWDANRVKYRTSKIMANAVAEAVNTAKNFPIITIWHGDGLTQALIRKGNLANAACADQLEKVHRLMGLRPQVVVTPPLITGQRTFWDASLAYLIPSDLPELINNIAVCEPRRAQAKYNTGTVPWEAAVYLRAMTRFYEPEVAVEIGTFIGTSALALHVKRVLYTCDRSNDCVPSLYSNDERNIVTFPGRSSTQMFEEIQEPVDFFFFDGRVQKEDLPHIQRLMKPSSVFVVDDYAKDQKGVANVELLASYLPQHTLIPPAGNCPSTLALLAPFHHVERKR